MIPTFVRIEQNTEHALITAMFKMQLNIQPAKAETEKAIRYKEPSTNGMKKHNRDIRESYNEFECTNSTAITTQHIETFF